MSDRFVFWSQWRTLSIEQICVTGLEHNVLPLWGGSRHLSAIAGWLYLSLSTPSESSANSERQPELLIMENFPKEPCIRCGVQIAVTHAVSLRTVMLLSETPQDQLVEKIHEIEGIAKDLAQEFVDHKMHRSCVKTEPPCPGCGAALKTWHAVHCLQCDWTRDEDKLLPEYYK